MTRAADKRPRVWPLRLVQASPLIVFALGLAVWFGVPAAARYVAIERVAQDNTNAFEDMPPELAVLTVLETAAQQASGDTEAYAPTDTMSEIFNIADVTTNGVMSNAWRLYDASGTLQPFAIPADDGVFARLGTYERASGARIVAFAVPARKDPPVALAAVTSLDGLSPAERREYETSGTLEALRRNSRDGITASALAPEPGSAGSMPATMALPVDAATMNSERLGTDEKRGVYASALAVGGHIYELYSTYPLSAPRTDVAGAPQLPDVRRLDSAANRGAIERLAKLTGGAVFVVGPTDDEPVPVRTPPEMPRSVATSLAHALATSLILAPETGVRHTEPSIAAVPGVGPWTSSVLGVFPQTVSVSTTGQVGAVAPMLYVAFWDRHPEIKLAWSRIGRTPARQLQVWLAIRLGFIFGALGLCFVASLVAAPLAFVRERTLTADFELEQERERVRRQARERVIDRLTVLSERIDVAATTASGDTSDQIALAARDIDSTVAQLKDILGDLAAEQGGRDV